MNVLFVCRANKNGMISSIVNTQAISLSELVNISIFAIKGKGGMAYINGIFSLRKYLKSHTIDIIHAHYSHSGYVASLASRKPVICSLMGSDIEDSRINRFLIKVFVKFFWKAVIVKSEKLKNRLKFSNAIVIPNGVDLDFFKPIPQINAREKIGIDLKKKVILFLADPSRPEKNFQLTKKAYDQIVDKKITDLITVFNIDYSSVPVYISASDVVLLTSHFEGSPNVIKEAMACNIPIVSTNVGDVSEILGDTRGCYICDYTPEDVASKINRALRFRDNFVETEGRKRIIQLGIDLNSIANRLTLIYKDIVYKSIKN